MESAIETLVTADWLLLVAIVGGAFLLGVFAFVSFLHLSHTYDKRENKTSSESLIQFLANAGMYMAGLFIVVLVINIRDLFRLLE